MRLTVDKINGGDKLFKEIMYSGKKYMSLYCTSIIT